MVKPDFSASRLPAATLIAEDRTWNREAGPWCPLPLDPLPSSSGFGSCWKLKLKRIPSTVIEPESLVGCQASIPVGDGGLLDTIAVVEAWVSFGCLDASVDEDIVVTSFE